MASIFLGVTCNSNDADGGEILVFAATSLTDALDEVISDYEAANSVDVLVSYGGSQALAQQIDAGAPADVFISAGQFPVDFLKSRQINLIRRTDLLSNELVLVARRGNIDIAGLEDLTSEAIRRVALASPDLAPAGLYAREALVNLGLWDSLQRKLIFGADVRAAMAYVETGNADVAFVYQTDTAISSSLEVIDIVPVASYSRIIYPAVLLPGGGSAGSAQDFFGFLSSDKASSAFDAHGFTVLPGEN